ncbi:hypothetical protein DID88_006595 [Monilinia fructigena]|uniref:2EXR domain-containing protein n=1 Tax=Monilinia fructigena TaxID=38457 RepID=A0A395IGZ3_9HELO|nr:hypothetical protein DID88_006595 [Monilinia fructigena]
MTSDRFSSLSPKAIGRVILQNLQKLSHRKQAKALPITTSPLNFEIGRELTTVSTIEIIDTPPPTPGFQQLNWPLPDQLPRMFLQSSNLTTFTLFPILPTELRIKIWQLAASQPRIVHITYDHPTESLVSLSPAPALLATCGESRDESLPFFKKLSLPNSACNSIIYLNLEVDTCYIRRATTSLEDASPYTSNFTTTKAIFGNNDTLSSILQLNFRLIWGDWDKNSKAEDLKLKSLETFKIVYAPVGPRPMLRKIRGHPCISYDDLEGFTILSKEDRWERRRRRHPIYNGEWMTESPFRHRKFSYRQGVFVKQDPIFFDRTHICEDKDDGERDFYCSGCRVQMSLGAYQAYIGMMERDVIGWKKPEFEGVKFERVEKRDTQYYLWA